MSSNDLAQASLPKISKNTEIDIELKGNPETTTQIENHRKLKNVENIQKENSPNILAKYIVKIRNGIIEYTNHHQKRFKIILIALGILLYNGYLITAINYTVSNNIPFGWCDGLGFLIILTGIVYWSCFYYLVLKRLLGRRIKKYIFKPLSQMRKSICRKW